MKADNGFMGNINTLAMCKAREKDVFDIISHYLIFQSPGLHCLVSAFIPSQIETLSPVDLTKVPSDYFNYFENINPQRPVIKDGLRIVPQDEYFPWLIFSGDSSSYWACGQISQDKDVFQGIFDDLCDGILGLSLFYRRNKISKEKIIFFIDIPDVEGYSIPPMLGIAQKSITISLKRVFCQREIDVNAPKEELLEEICSLVNDFHSQVPFPLGVLAASLIRLKQTPLPID